MSSVQSLSYSPLPYFAARDKSIISEIQTLRIEDIPIKNHKTSEQRGLLVSALKNNYENIDEVNSNVLDNIKSLLNDNTYTVVTAHQPNLFLGPLYFIYKILSAIRLTEELNNLYSDKHFVPVYWMGSEDHDLEELNWISAYNRKWTWETTQTGAVGRMKTADLQPLLAELLGVMGESENSILLQNILKKSYNGVNTIAEATFIFVNYLFGEYGLLVLNQDVKDLKALFSPMMQRELVERKTENLVLQDIADLEKQGYKAQAMPRNINLFYHTKDFQRSRIVCENGVFSVLNSDLTFTEEAILTELKQHPERFSPNVVLRPVYQEAILPNIAYIGGGGELAYWQERKRVFEYFNLPFPTLIRRQSFLLINSATQRKMEKVGMTADDIWQNEETIIKSYIAKNTENELNLSTEKDNLKEIFEQILVKARLTDNSLEKAVLGEQQKMVNSLEQLEQKIMRAEKRNHETAIQQIKGVYEKLFPNKILQERYDSFIPYYILYGKSWLEELKDAMNPLFTSFLIIND